MRGFTSIWQRVRMLVRRQAIQTGLEDEIAFHIEHQTAKYIHAGMTPDEARRHALLRFGGVEDTKERARDAFRIPAVEDIARELRHGGRALWRARGFTAAAVLTLALGIGGTTAVFALINGVLLKPLPYPEADRLVSVWQTAKGVVDSDINMSASQYFTYREQNRVFEALGVWSEGAVNVTGLGSPERVPNIRVTCDVLPVLGVAPLLGRWFAPDEDTRGAAGTVLVSYGYWQRALGGDANVIGRTLTVDAAPRRVIGVMPKDFRFLGVKYDLILPQRFGRDGQMLVPFDYNGLARLKRGMSIADANADAARLFPVFVASWPEHVPGFRQLLQNSKVTPDVRPLKRDVIGNVGDVLWVLMGTIGIVLVIACANVANLLLVRIEGRQHELAVRTALGAGWPRLARALLLEHLTLAAMGGALGLCLAFGILRLLVAIAPETLPRLDEIVVDFRVTAFAAGISLVAVLMFGILPIARHKIRAVRGVLAGGGRTASESRDRHRVRNALLVGQVALSLILLVASGLMLRTFTALRVTNPGFSSPETIQLARVAIADGSGKPDQTAHTFATIRGQFASIPGVRSVGFGWSVPMDGQVASDILESEDNPTKSDRLPSVRQFEFISPGYFETLGTPIVAGRDLLESDVESRRLVVLVSENMAREMWNDPARAIGKRVREDPRSPWREIIGVVGDVYRQGVHEKAPATVYFPIVLENFWGNRLFVRDSATFMLRTERAGTEPLVAEMRARLSAVRPDLPLSSIRTFGEVYKRSMARTSFALVMLAVASGMALSLALVGVYAAIAYTVVRRRREIGIRMALGAQRMQLTGALVGRSLLLAVIGSAIGTAGAVPLARVMRSLLFGVEPIDVTTYAVTSVAVVAAVALVSYIPARRTSSVEPVEALRAE